MAGLRHCGYSESSQQQLIPRPKVTAPEFDSTYATSSHNESAGESPAQGGAGAPWTHRGRLEGQPIAGVPGKAHAEWVSESAVRNTRES